MPHQQHLLGRQHTGDFVERFYYTTESRDRIPFVYWLQRGCAASLHTGGFCHATVSYYKIVPQSHPCVAGVRVPNESLSAKVSTRTLEEGAQWSKESGRVQMRASVSEATVRHRLKVRKWTIHDREPFWCRSEPQTNLFSFFLS